MQPITFGRRKEFTGKSLAVNFFGFAIIVFMGCVVLFVCAKCISLFSKTVFAVSLAFTSKPNLNQKRDPKSRFFLRIIS